MRPEYIFPTVMIGLSMASAMCYATQMNWRMTIYWIAAATLTSCVTFGE